MTTLVHEALREALVNTWCTPITRADFRLVVKCRTCSALQHGGGLRLPIEQAAAGK